MLISSRFEVVGMAERSNLRNQPQNGDSISLVENEAIRTTSLVTNDQIDALSHITMQQIQQSSNQDYFFLHELDETVVELEPRFSGFWNGIVSKYDGPFCPHNVSQCSEGLEMGLSCDRLAQYRNVPSLQNSIDGKKRKMSYDDASQPTASEDANDAYEENKVSEKQDEENSQLKHIHLSNSEASVILSRFSAEALEEDRGLMRAKRGEAMSRHSLAERNRRERISERMKFLQGLVPGCDKITGKAVMLDEIINYVVSLQHQVEFLSMKLALVDAREQAENGQFGC